MSETQEQLGGAGGALGQGMAGLPTEYMTTTEAAKYLRKSTSWLLRQKDIAYMRGKPNTYFKGDLDEWFERSKYQPKVA